MTAPPAEPAAGLGFAGVGLAVTVVISLVWTLIVRMPGEVSGPGAGGPTAGLSAHLPGCAQRVQVPIFFGMSTPRGPVSEAEWTRFLQEVVTPRFPRGLTVVHAHGQWRGRGAAAVTREAAEVVEVVDDGVATGRQVAEIVAHYRERFQQESVMVTRGPIEVCY